MRPSVRLINAAVVPNVMEGRNRLLILSEGYAVDDLIRRLEENLSDLS